MTNLPPVIRSAWVARPPSETFAVFTDEIGAWWPLASHGLFGARAGGLSFRDGHLIEQSIDGTETVWGEILEWDPPAQLVITWHPGREPSHASQVQVDFEADGEGTRVVLEHRGWDTFGADAMAARRSYVGPSAWGSVLDHFADGAEPRHDAVDLTELASGYYEFFALAEKGEFGPAPAGEWNADQVVAHMALNDAAMIGVCQALIHHQEPHFENQTCQDLDVLASFIESCSDRTELIRRGRSAARQVQAAIGRLSPDQLATEVPCRLSHDGEIVMEEARPWQAIAISAQTGMHLPAHISQLQDLRQVK